MPRLTFDYLICVCFVICNKYLFCKEIKNDIDQKMMNSMKTPQEIAEMISKTFYPLPDADLDSLALDHRIK